MIDACTCQPKSTVCTFESSNHSYFSTEGSIRRNEDSIVLESVTIHSDGNQVNVICHFRPGSSPSQQCVMVIRKSTQSILVVQYYPVGTDFPVTLPLSEPGNYSVAVFGWTEGMIETSPTTLEQVHIEQGDCYYMCTDV